MEGLSPEKSYSKLPLLSRSLSDNQENNELQPKPVHSRMKPWWMLLVWIASASLLVMSTVFITLATVSNEDHHHHQYKQQTSGIQSQRITKDQPLHCGKSVDEAIRLGCTFDPMSLQWLRPECRRTGNDEYLEFLGGNLTYWVDRNGSTPVHDLSRQVNDDGFWGQQRQHVAHCAFVYVRLIEAATTDGIYDRKTWSPHHAKHCASVLLNWAMRAPDMTDAKQWAHVSFGTCWQRGGL